MPSASRFLIASVLIAVSVSADCPLAGTYKGTSILTRIGRATVQSCTRPNGPGTPLLDSEGNQCRRAVCRDQDIIFQAAGDTCDRLTIFQPGGCGAPVLPASCNEGVVTGSTTTFTCTVEDVSFSIPVTATLTDGTNLQWDLGDDALLGSISGVRQCSLVGSYNGTSTLTLLGRAATGGCFLDDTGALVNSSGLACLPAFCGPSIPITFSAATEECDALTITLDPTSCPGAPPVSASCLQPVVDESGIEKFTCRVSPGLLEIPVEAQLIDNFLSWKLDDGLLGEISGLRG
mmetsp:Transcript_5383/g.7939  ORF Transcript_5383/g.7939 Transcript_5383/m.7939 type:complete len:290 (-) Transcript_5383:229-1098(-)